MALPRPLSHSSISMYRECPQKYKFKYIDNIPEKPRHFFSFGSSVHAALEFFYGVKAPPAPTLDQLLGYYKEHWISAGYRDAVQERQYFEDGKAILTAFYKKHVASFEIPFFVEYQFNLEVGGVPVTGKVDRIDKLGDGRISILDYKTGKALAEDRVLTDAQLTMYQMACEKLLGREVARLSFYHLPSLTESAVERHSEEQVELLRGRIVQTAESIVKGAFEPRPEERKCRWCDYKPICPIFKHQYPPPPAVVPSEEELVELIDRYGQLQEQVAALGEEAVRIKRALAEALEKKGYVRAFGKKYEVARAAPEKWEFSDKKKVIELIKKAGLYDRILAPSAPKVEQLMADPQLDLDLRARLEELGEKVRGADLKAKPL